MIFNELAIAFCIMCESKGTEPGEIFLAYHLLLENETHILVLLKARVPLSPNPFIILVKTSVNPTPRTF
jgi:hypothetical protein